ncbi:AraC family transcriptional regulator, partial [Streptomyces rubellomurinus subsp. indigoferus]
LPDQSLAPVLAWAQQHPDSPLTIADLAARAEVSTATLHRRLRAQLGTTPLRCLTRERPALACGLTGRGESRFDVVARPSALATAANPGARTRSRTGFAPPPR